MGARGERALGGRAVRSVPHFRPVTLHLALSANLTMIDRQRGKPRRCTTKQPLVARKRREGSKERRVGSLGRREIQLDDADDVW